MRPTIIVLFVTFHNNYHAMPAEMLLLKLFLQALYYSSLFVDYVSYSICVLVFSCLLYLNTRSMIDVVYFFSVSLVQ